MNTLKKLGLVLGALLFLSTAAEADCNGQFSAGQTCGNSGASNAPPSATLLSPLLDRNFAPTVPQGTILNRGASLWTATRSPVLGKPGTNTGTLGLGSITGGTATITPPAIAGNTAVQLPTLAGTIPTTATTPLVLNATTGALTCPTCVTGTAGALTAGVTTTSGFTAGQILYSDGSLLQAAGAVKATSLALGGATIGSDGLGVTGSATISSTVTGGAFIPTSNTAPSDGMYLNSVGQTAFSAGSTRIFFFNSTGLLMANAAGATLTSTAATATVPTLVPRRSDSATGIGSNATASLSLIATSIEQLRINNGSIYVGGAATGSNIAAVAPTISAALSTGNATNPDLVFQTGVLTSSGSGQATATTGLTIKGETRAVQIPVSLAIGGATIGSNALAVTGSAAISSTLTSAALTVTSSSASALSVGLNGATNPALQVDASTASSATGLKIKSAAAAGGLAISVVTSGTNENLAIDAAGSGTITLGGVSTGAIIHTRATTLSAALTYGGVTFANTATGTGSLVGSISPTFTGTLAAAAITATTLNGNTFTTGTYTLTGTAGKTLTFSNSVTLAGTDGTTLTGPSTNATLAALNIVDQTLTGGANVTLFAIGTVSSGTTTLDCGKSPLQTITNNGAFTLAGPASDGSCIVRFTNGASAGTITFSGWTVGSNTGDTYATTNANKYDLFVRRINGASSYQWSALQ